MVTSILGLTLGGFFFPSVSDRGFSSSPRFLELSVQVLTWNTSERVLPCPHVFSVLVQTSRLFLSSCFCEIEIQLSYFITPPYLSHADH